MADRIKVQCADCGAGFKVDAGHVGKRAKCKHCGEVFTIEEEIPRLEDAGGAAYDIADDPASSQVLESPSYSGAAVDRSDQPRLGSRFPREAWNVGGVAGFWASLNSHAKIAVFGSIGVLLIVGIVFAVSGKALPVAGDNPPQASKPLVQIVKSPAPLRNIAAQLGPLPAIRFIQENDGTRTAHVQIRGRHAKATDVWICLPPGTHANASVPCVFICPAGSATVTGVPFGPNERDIFHPLAFRGMAVCFYSLDGTIEQKDASRIHLAQAIRDFMKARAGMDNLADAIDLVLADVPEVDPKRLGTCGHSSAGTIAVMAVAQEPRISAAAVMAPTLDLPKWLGPDTMVYLRRELPDYGVDDASPSNVKSFSHPIYIIQAADDDSVPISEAKAFAAKHPDQITLEIVPHGRQSGGYYMGKTKVFEFLANTFNASPSIGAKPATPR
jgi:dienelactone hydrolase